MLLFRPDINPRAYATPQLEQRATVLIETRTDGRTATSDKPRQKELLAIVHELTRRAQAVIITYR
jgi:hypothetical protein